MSDSPVQEVGPAVRPASGPSRGLLRPLLVTVAMLALGFWMRWPTLAYSGEPDQTAFNDYAFERFSYSDIASLYFRDKLVDHPRPYFDYPLEYPVGMGAMIYLLNSARTLQSYFLATSLFMAACALLIAWLVPRFPRGNPWLMALSPALAFYVNLNWDMWAVLLTVGALLLFVRERDTSGALLLAAAVSTKFFPIVILPLILAERGRDRRPRAALRIAAIFTLASAAINLPLLAARPQAWLLFFELSRTRPREVNLWNFFDRWSLTTPQINSLSLVLLALGLAVLVWAVWRGRVGAFLPASCAALAWFFFVNKVYSPQYSLWVVVLLAVVGAAPALAAVWSAADLIYFCASFLILGMIRFGAPTTDWFFQRALMPAMALREGMLLLVAGWCLWRMRGDRSTLDGPVEQAAVSAPPAASG